MTEWLWEAQAEAGVLSDAIDSVMNQLQHQLASESNHAGLAFCIRLSIEELLVQNPGIIVSHDEKTPHKVVVRSNRREFTIGIDSQYNRFTFSSTE